MSTGQSIHSSVAWLFVGNSGRQVLTFLFGIVLARLLAPEDFGALLTIQVFTGVAAFFAGGGMGQALIRAKKATRKDYDIVFTMQLIIGCLIYTVFYFLAPWFAKWYDNPLYTNLLRVTALSFIYRPFVNLPGNKLTREMRFKARAIIAFVSLLISSTTSITLAYYGYGVWSLVWGGIANAIVTALLLAPTARWRPRLSLAFHRGRKLAKYGMLKAINDIVFYLRTQASIFLLSRTLGVSSVGLYNKGESLARIPHTFLTGSVYPVLFRTLSKEQENQDKCRYLFFRSITLLAVYATPFYVGLIWLSEPLIKTIYGDKWLASAGPLSILAMAWPFWLMGNLSGNVLAAKNWLHRELFVQISSLIITCLAIIIALPYGIDGVAWAIVGATAYAAIHQYFLATSCLAAKRFQFFVAIVPALLLNGLLALTLYGVDRWLPEPFRSDDLFYLLAMTLAGGAIYGLCFLFLPFQTLRPEQRRWKTKLRLA